MKINWKHANEEDLERLKIIESLVGDHTHLLDFIFHQERTELAGPLKVMKSDMECFEEEEQVLILCALDLWGTYGGIHLDDLYKKLSSKNFANCLKAMELFRKLIVGESPDWFKVWEKVYGEENKKRASNLNWEGADEGDLIHLEAISTLLGRHTRFLDFIFNRNKPVLSRSVKEIKYEMGVFSSGEKILILAALDIWCSEGKLHLDDLCTNIDEENFRDCLKVLVFLKEKLSCSQCKKELYNNMKGENYGIGKEELLPA